MPKSTQWTDVAPTITVQFNRIHFDPNSTPEEQYIPITITANAVTTTPDAGRRDVEVQQEIGGLREEPLTLRQIYALLNEHAAPLAAVFKELVISAINEDPEEE